MPIKVSLIEFESLIKRRGRLRAMWSGCMISSRRWIIGCWFRQHYKKRKRREILRKSNCLRGGFKCLQNKRLKISWRKRDLSHCRSRSTRRVDLRLKCRVFLRRKWRKPQVRNLCAHLPKLRSLNHSNFQELLIWANPTRKRMTSLYN